MREMFDALHGIDMNASPPPQGKVETYAMARTRADVLYVSVAFAPTSSGTSLLELGLTNVKWLWVSRVGIPSDLISTPILIATSPAELGAAQSNALRRDEPNSEWCKVQALDGK